MNAYFVKQLPLFRRLIGAKRFFSASASNSTCTAAAFNSTTGNIDLTINSAKKEVYPLWLRDHCKCSACYNFESEQRLFNTAKLPLNIKPTEIKNENGLSITWEDGHESKYENSALESLLGTESKKTDLKYWTKKDISASPPTVAHDKLLNSDEVLLDCLEKLETYGFVVISGVPVSPAATKIALERISPIRETFFGGLWDFTSNMEHADTAYSTIELRSHTDGTYFKSTPGYQAFHCLEYNGTGGNSMLVDGFNIAKTMKKDYLEHYNLLKNTPIPCQYIDNVRNYHFLTKLPMFSENESGELVQIRFNNYDRAPIASDMMGSVSNIRKFYEALQIFSNLIQRPENEHEFLLTPGNLLVFDNWRVFHGRKEYSGHRRLCGSYLDKDDVTSKMKSYKVL